MDQGLRDEILRHEYKTDLFVELESQLSRIYGGYVSIRKDLEFIEDTL